MGKGRTAVKMGEWLWRRTEGTGLRCGPLEVRAAEAEPNG